MEPKWKKWIFLGQPADPQRVKERLDQDVNREIKAVLVTHNETSTGVFNDMKAIGEALGSHPALLMVDAISGLATIDLKMDEWNLDVVVSGSQKLLCYLPDYRVLWLLMKRPWRFTNNQDASLLLGCSQGLKYLEKGQNPYTPAASLYYGLAESLRIMKGGRPG